VEFYKYSTGNFVTRHKIIDKPHINVINDLLNPHGSDETRNCISSLHREHIPTKKL